LKTNFVLFFLFFQTFGADDVNALIGLAPDPEEIATMQSYEGDEKLLDKCATFFNVVKDIPDIKGRLKHWLFKLTVSQDHFVLPFENFIDMRSFF
jgi:hypothetical protein